jgi:hypothetical protein
LFFLVSFSFQSKTCLSVVFWPFSLYSMLCEKYTSISLKWFTGFYLLMCAFLCISTWEFFHCYLGFLPCPKPNISLSHS